MRLILKYVLCRCLYTVIQGTEQKYLNSKDDFTKAFLVSYLENIELLTVDSLL